jgi:hypothetical protein
MLQFSKRSSTVHSINMATTLCVPATENNGSGVQLAKAMSTSNNLIFGDV